MVEAPIADVAPRAEFDRVARELERVEALYFAKDTQLENAKAEVAREIFEEIEEARKHWESIWKSDHYGSGGGAYGYLETDVDSTIYDLKKKYTEGEK
jgi:hypothetical protein